MAIRDWFGVCEMVQCRWTCGHCGLMVAGNQGFYQENPKTAAPQHRHGLQPSRRPNQSLPPQQITAQYLRIMICPNCEKPTYFEGSSQMPGVAFGGEVDHLPGPVAELYGEARNCMAVSAYTASVLATRKLLMNVAVNQGAPPGQPFQQYVEFLSQKGYVPPNAATWVDHIRKKGNEATHEIPSIGEADAKDLLTFIEMILKLVFEFPNRVPPKS